ncbi:hypothetical protein [Actinomadura sp. HBU206391]|uniref:hypothetical protein n=1 Tax=Actinomadura sp. HBU206391 TaxID=2731692 RepID=UPI00164F32D9|nr:hypothetical protein [Actinomadura sp. HBU206391]MBC6456662.1 hypothetical protein [Actinomadura sp. HBU206391]
MSDDEDEVTSYVAACPITPELVQQIVGLTELSWDDPKGTGLAMRGLGWRSDEVPLDPGRFVTGEGHIVYGDGCFAMPFSYSYWVDGEMMQDDFWGLLRGWSSLEDPGPQVFDAHVNAAIDRFAERLGRPEHDVSTEARGRYSWRYAAWRRGGNVLVVGQTLDGFSYHQHEQALVYIGALAEDAPFPTAAEFAGFLSW